MEELTLAQDHSEKELHDTAESIADAGTGVESEENEDPDSIDEPIEDPFNPAQIRVSIKPLTLDLLLKRMRNDEIDLAPDFQRKAGVWNLGAQSRLIESILIRIPLPAFYMDATDEEKWIVVDGLQRLTTLKSFVIDQSLTLRGMEFLGQFNGLKFKSLPRNFQRRIEETQITVFLIEAGTPPEVKFNIFKRINTGGLPLSSQEIRHALNQGPVTRLLASLANSRAFVEVTNGSVKDERMGGREMILRFFAFLLVPFDQYNSKDLDSFLNDRMADINKMPEVQRQNLERRFKRAVRAAHNVFGRLAFRKVHSLNGYLNPINKALFETWTVTLDSLTDDQIVVLERKKDLVVEKFIALARDYAFESAISQSTGNIAKVHLRFERIRGLVNEVLS